MLALGYFKSTERMVRTAFSKSSPCKYYRIVQAFMMNRFNIKCNQILLPHLRSQQHELTLAKELFPSIIGNQYRDSHCSPA